MCFAGLQNLGFWKVTNGIIGTGTKHSIRDSTTLLRAFDVREYHLNVVIWGFHISSVNCYTCNR